MMCSGTKYSHENFFIHKMSQIFFPFLFLLGVNWDCGSTVFLLPIKSGKKASFHPLFVKM